MELGIRSSLWLNQSRCLGRLFRSNHRHHIENRIRGARAKTGYQPLVNPAPQLKTNYKVQFMSCTALDSRGMTYDFQARFLLKYVNLFIIT